MLTVDSKDSVGPSPLPLDPTRYFLWISIYFALHVLTRSLISQNLQLDEAEQLILTQDWRLGYGSQPPLYTWILKLVFKLFGSTVFSLALFKNFCLWTVFVFVFLSAREMISKRLAVVASLSLLFIPQLSWESQRDQTHLVLATACAAATLFVFIKAAGAGNIRWFLLFGLTTALGVLSKYNFAILPVALLVSALLTRPMRASVWNIRMLWAGVLFVAIVAPHLLWALGHQSLVTSQTYKFQIQSEGGWLISVGIVVRFLIMSLAFIAPPLLVIILLSFGSVRGIWNNRSTLNWNRHLKFLVNTMAIGLAIVLLMTLVFRVTHLRDRWLQPLLFPLPLVLVGIFAYALDRQSIRRLQVMAAVVAAMVLFTINGTVLFADVLGRPHNLNFPFESLAQRIHQAGFNRDIMVADGFFLGGNLKMRFPEARVIVPEYSNSISNDLPDLVVWNSSGTCPPSVLNFHDGKGCSSVPQYFDLTSRNGSRHTERVGVMVIQNSNPESE